MFRLYFVTRAHPQVLTHCSIPTVTPTPTSGCRWQATCKWREENDVDDIIHRPQPRFDDSRYCLSQRPVASPLPVLRARCALVPTPHERFVRNFRVEGSDDDHAVTQGLIVLQILTPLPNECVHAVSGVRTLLPRNQCMSFATGESSRLSSMAEVGKASLSCGSKLARSIHHWRTS